MRMRVLIPAVAAALLAAPAAASAAFMHVIAPGESLTSIAAADGLSVAQLAAANGLPLDAQLVSGATIAIPPQNAGLTSTPATTSSSGSVSSAGTGAGDGDNDSDDPTFVSSSTASSAPGSSSGGSYVVQPGDTLTAIASRAGLSISSLAAANGLDPNGILVSGTVLRLSGTPATTFVSTSTGSTSGNAAVSQPVGAAAQGSPTDPPFPTPERLTAGQIGQIAANNGVSSSLADAIAWQESGFNNDLVSSADARGIMQITPGTWSWIQSSLDTGGPPLAPASASDNVRGGVLLLNSLLNATGGDPAMAAAGYYQGLPSVRQNGLFPSTQQYVQDVMALRQQFGGG